MKKLLSLCMAMILILLTFTGCFVKTPDHSGNTGITPGGDSGTKPGDNSGTKPGGTEEKPENSFNVYFLTGIDLTIDSVVVEAGKTFSAPSFTPVDHYTLEGWYLDEEYTSKWSFETDVVTKDTILYAKWDFEPYEYTIKLPTTHLLDNATDIQKVEDAPDLMILEIVLDSSEYIMGSAMSNYEYIKVFNNTESEYNLKDHRIILANPASGQNGETEEARAGLLPLVTNYLFMGYIDEDFVIPPLSTALIWMKPYYWTAGSGTGAYNKPFSTKLIHTTSAGEKGGFEQTLDDFREYWEIPEGAINILELTNMGFVGKRSMATAGTDGFYPIYSPGSGTMYTHLNSGLLRSIEIQKLNTNDGEISADILNKYSELSPEKQENPDFIYGKQCFNVLELRYTADNSVVDAYLPENIVKYFEPIVRATFCGRVDTSAMAVGQQYVDFTSTSNPGVKYWDQCVGLQFRPPVKGERVMQWQLPINELRWYDQYMTPSQREILRLCSDVVKTYRFESVAILVNVDPEQNPIDFKTNEIKSDNRIRAASPLDIKLINLTYPTNP